jgi:hypothetical protein
LEEEISLLWERENLRSVETGRCHYGEQFNHWAGLSEIQINVSLANAGECLQL